MAETEKKRKKLGDGEMGEMNVEGGGVGGGMEGMGG